MTLGSQTGTSGVRPLRSLNNTVTSEKSITNHVTMAARNVSRVSALVFTKSFFTSRCFYEKWYAKIAKFKITFYCNSGPPA